MSEFIKVDKAPKLKLFALLYDAHGAVHGVIDTLDEPTIPLAGDAIKTAAARCEEALTHYRIYSVPACMPLTDLEPTGAV